jgi:hypothetical protein
MLLNIHIQGFGSRFRYFTWRPYWESKSSWIILPAQQESKDLSSLWRSKKHTFSPQKRKRASSNSKIGLGWFWLWNWQGELILSWEIVWYIPRLRIYAILYPGERERYGICLSGTPFYGTHTHRARTHTHRARRGSPQHRSICESHFPELGL